MSPAGSSRRASAGWLSAAVIAPPDSTGTCHSFRSRDWDHQCRPDELGFADTSVAELPRTLRARYGAPVRGPADAPHQTIYALIARRIRVPHDRGSHAQAGD